MEDARIQPQAQQVATRAAEAAVPSKTRAGPSLESASTAAPSRHCDEKSTHRSLRSLTSQWEVRLSLCRADAAASAAAAAATAATTATCTEATDDLLEDVLFGSCPSGISTLADMGRIDEAPARDESDDRGGFFVAPDLDDVSWADDGRSDEERADGCIGMCSNFGNLVDGADEELLVLPPPTQLRMRCVTPEVFQGPEDVQEQDGGGAHGEGPEQTEGRGATGAPPAPERPAAPPSPGPSSPFARRLQRGAAAAARRRGGPQASSAAPPLVQLGAGAAAPGPAEAERDAPRAGEAEAAAQGGGPRGSEEEEQPEPGALAPAPLRSGGRHNDLPLAGAAGRALLRRRTG